MCPPWTEKLHEQIEYELDCAYHDGYRQALEYVAAGHVELGHAWRPVGIRTHQQRISERLAVLESCADAITQQLYPDGGTWWI